MRNPRAFLSRTAKRAGKSHILEPGTVTWLEKLGKIEGAYIADIVMVDDAFRPKAVWVRGELRWVATEVKAR
jgi:N-acetylglucosamine-6-phosphate deacetylase